jgi:hypothetical protein
VHYAGFTILIYYDARLTKHSVCFGSHFVLYEPVTSETLRSLNTSRMLSLFPIFKHDCKVTHVTYSLIKYLVITVEKMLFMRRIKPEKCFDPFVSHLYTKRYLFKNSTLYSINDDGCSTLLRNVIWNVTRF